MTGWRNRVTEELAQVNGRASALTMFIGRAPEFTMLPAEHQVLLRAQLPIMRAYAEILAARLSLPDQMPAEPERA